MSNILFICSGNYCRSPMAEALLRRRLSLSGVVGVSVESAGTTQVHSGKGASKNLIEVLGQWNLHGFQHISHRVTSDELNRAGVVFYMERNHLYQLHDIYKEMGIQNEPPTLLLSTVIGGGFDIPDPYPALKSGDPEPSDVRSYILVGHMLDYIFKAGLPEILRHARGEYD